MTEEITLKDSRVYWAAFRSTLTHVNYNKHVDRAFDSYAEFYNFFKVAPNSYNAPSTLLISDLYTKLALISEPNKVYLLDVEETKDKVFKLVDIKDLQARFETLLKANYTNYTIKNVDIRVNHYKLVLDGYKKVTFFDQFNTFKYLISKEMRADLEACIYQFFTGILTREALQEQLAQRELLLKPSQLKRYLTVKSFLISDRADILRELVVEPDPEVLKEQLETHALDYFDVNYLKAFLRDFGKTKEEKRKRKERVQSVTFKDSEPKDN